MTAKDFLLSVRKAELELKIISAKRKHFEDLIESIGSNMKKAVVQTSGGSSKTETAAIGLVDIMEQLVEKENEYIRLIRKADELIAKIPQDQFRRVLILRYLCGKGWKDIKKEMGYKDEKSVYRCHGYALRKLQEVMQ